MKTNYLITGNCIEKMKTFKDQSIDLILTDPPYNAESIGPKKRIYILGEMQFSEKKYKKFCREWVSEALRISHTLVFTPGISNMCFYPQPKWSLCWHKPQAVSFNRMGGFNVWEPIFIYGDTKKGERITRDLILQHTFNSSKGPEKNHPCPKPLPLIKKMILLFLNKGDVILDPFLGSGTTAVAAKELGRKYIGIEINPEYVKISTERLAQDNLFYNNRYKEI